MPYIYLILAFTLNSIANLALKYATQHEPEVRPLNFNFAYLSDHRWLIFGLVLFASNVIFYTLALKYLAISVAYPVMVAMSLVIIAIGAHFLFKESITNVQLIGYILLIIAIYLVSYK